MAEALVLLWLALCLAVAWVLMLLIVVWSGIDDEG